MRDAGGRRVRPAEGPRRDEPTRDEPHRDERRPDVARRSPIIGRPLRDRPLRDHATPILPAASGPRRAAAQGGRHLRRQPGGRIAHVGGRRLVALVAVVAVLATVAAAGTLGSRPAVADASPSVPSGAGSHGTVSAAGGIGRTADPDDPSSCAAVAAQSPAPIDAAIAARLGDALDTARRSLPSPGLTAAILMPDGRGWAGAVGIAADGVPLTPEVALPWASAGKPAIAATIVRLAAAGKIHLSDAVRSWLPLPAAKGATVADMLAHRAGLSDPFNDPAFTRRIEADQSARWAPDAVLDWVVPVLDRGVFLYSNADYIAAGRMIEKATGEAWPTVVRRLVLRPAGSRAAAPALEPVCEQLGHSFDRTSGGWADLTASSGLPPYPSVLTAIDSAGGLVGTATDLVLVGREVTMNPDLAVMLAPRGSVTAEGPYGLGVSRLPVLGRAAVGHGGHLAGARSMWRCIVGGPCVAIIANRADIELEPTAETLLGIVLGR